MARLGIRHMYVMSMDMPTLTSPMEAEGDATPSSRKSRRMSREFEEGNTMSLLSNASPRSSALDSAPWDEDEDDDGGVPDAAQAVPSKPAQEESDDSDDDESSDAYLARMMQARQQRPAGDSSPGSFLKRGSPAAQRPMRGQGGPMGVRSALPTPPPEEGWEFSSPVARRGKPIASPARPSLLGGEAAAGEPSALAGGNESTAAPRSESAAAQTRTPAQSLAEQAAAAERLSNGTGDVCGLDDEEFGGYSAAKDGSRRRVGKHGRSTMQAVKRGYAIDARNAQRDKGR